jgi:hypothetical protein
MRLPMSDEKFFYAKSGYAPYRDGSGFQVTATIEQDTATSEPTISIESVFRLPVSDWIVAARKIERMLDLIQRPSDVGNVSTPEVKP